MDELDGNRAAGLLREVFGREMTAAIATCGSCEAVAPPRPYRGFTAELAAVGLEQSTGFVLDPQGKVMVSVYSSGTIGLDLTRDPP